MVSGTAAVPLKWSEIKQALLGPLPYAQNSLKKLYVGNLGFVIVNGFLTKRDPNLLSALAEKT